MQFAHSWALRPHAKPFARATRSRSCVGPVHAESGDVAFRLVTNREVAVSFLDAVYRGDYEVCAPLVGESIEWINRATGVHARTPEELTLEMQEDAGWSDRTLRVERVMETTDGTVIVQGTVDATHIGPWHSIPGTGKRATFTVCVLLKFDSQGRIVSVDRYADHLSAMISIGAVQLPDP